MRDLIHAPVEVVAAERARVGTEDWSAKLLTSGEDGQWPGGAVLTSAELQPVIERKLPSRGHGPKGEPTYSARNAQIKRLANLDSTGSGSGQ